MSHATTFTSMIFDAWPAIAQCPIDWQPLIDHSVGLFDHTTCYWELHADGQRVDLCANAHLADPRSRARVDSWLTEDNGTTRPIRAAQKALTLWLNAPALCGGVGWEVDTKDEGIGVFVANPKAAPLDDLLATATKSFELSPRVSTRAAAFLTEIQGVYRPIALGYFFGRDLQNALRVVVRPTHAHDLNVLPHSLVAEVQRLFRELPVDSDANLALTITEDTIYVAIEARCQHTDTTRKDAWCHAIYPDRTALHDTLFGICRQPWARPAHWSHAVLLDTFLAPPQTVPWIRADISHVKVRRQENGRVERKCYGHFHIVWRPPFA